LDEHFSGRRNSSGHIWRLLIFELWHRNFLETFASRGMGDSESCAPTAAAAGPA
jgi:hypothetical protein